MNDKKNPIESAQIGAVTPAFPIDQAQQNCSTDSIKEMSVSSASAEIISENDFARKKKVAALKQQYADGELKAQPSRDLAQRLLKKLGF